MRAPAGIRGFRDIRERGLCHVDRTRLADVVPEEDLTMARLFVRPMGWGRGVTAWNRSSP